MGDLTAHWSLSQESNLIVGYSEIYHRRRQETDNSKSLRSAETSGQSQSCYQSHSCPGDNANGVLLVPPGQKNRFSVSVLAMEGSPKNKTQKDAVG